MKDFLIYFFGQGDTQEFALMTPAHILPIVIMLATIFLIRRYKEQLRRFRHEETLRYILGFALIICDMSYYWRLASSPALVTGAQTGLPIGVCMWAVILCCFLVIGKKQIFFDIAYFWLLSGTVFALLTPTVLTYTGPTRYRYYQFWLEHTLGYIAIFYMIFVHNMRPTVKSAIRSYVALLVLAVIAFWVNSMIPGANYLYMARPEDAPSVLDILPPNFALRTAVIVAVITLMFGLAYLPWYLKDKKAKALELTQTAV
jgi:hypothetical integral membrane protein (TIGR02206 family)